MQRVLSDEGAETSLKFVKEKRYRMERTDKSGKKDVEESYVNSYPKLFGYREGFMLIFKRGLCIITTHTHTYVYIHIFSILPIINYMILY